jgi:hypothetical protein
LISKPTTVRKRQIAKHLTTVRPTGQSLKIPIK